MNAGDEEFEAKERLLGLLRYVKEVVSKSESEASTVASLDIGSEAFCVHEATLRRLEPVRCVNFDAKDGAWLRLRRPTSEDSGELSGRAGAAAAVLARKVYSELFTVRQEALREGLGVQLAVGVGLVRWRLAGGAVIEHPLVLLPAALELDPDGSLVVRGAEACGASLWPFAGVPEAAPVRRTASRRRARVSFEDSYRRSSLVSDVGNDRRVC